MKTVLIGIVAVVALFFLSIAAFFGGPKWVFQYRARHIIGLSEAQVIERLGHPDEIMTAEQASRLPPGKQWYTSTGGWQPTGEVHPLTNRALFYVAGVWCAIVHIGKDGKVEAITWTGT
jgi:hypothetical protein